MSHVCVLQQVAQSAKAKGTRTLNATVTTIILKESVLAIAFDAIALSLRCHGPGWTYKRRWT